MKKFTLLVDGKNLDTGNYGYFPYTDKKISDFETTFRVSTQLKTGKLSEDSELAREYIFAKYCIGVEDTNRIAIESASKAFKRFRDFSLSKRKKIFFDLYKILLENKEEFINLLVIEGHPRKLAEWEFEGMEMGGRPETIEFFCKQLQKEIGKSPKERLYWVRKPDGVICLSPPNNAAASNSYLAAYVFLTGNALVIKPPLRDPLSTIFLWKEIVYKALMKNDVPPEILNITLGNSLAITEEWLSSPFVNDMLYFGDSKKGLEIGVKAFQAGKKPILELSGNDFLIIWKDADLDKATDSLLECFLGSTQICMVPKIALVHENIYDPLMRVFLEKVKRIKPGLPSQLDTMLSPVAKMKEFFEFLEDALKKGASLMCGGQRINLFDQEDKNGIFIRPTVLRIDNVKNIVDMRCLKEEIFFPLLPIVKVTGKDEDIFEKINELVNSHGYGLRVSLWIKSPAYLRRFGRHIDNCGLLRINTRHVGFSLYLSTHGGTRQSGGPFGEMNYLWQKSSHLQGITLHK